MKSVAVVVVLALGAVVLADPDAAWIADAVNQHNALRAKHGVPPLTYSADISKVSQAWANNLAATNTFAHNPNNKGYGENIYATSTQTIDGKSPVNAWYAEISAYPKDYSNPQMTDSLFPKVGHFTQVVWKASSQVGFGMARGTSWTYVVANYNPAGNMWSNASFVANVLKPTS